MRRFPFVPVHAKDLEVGDWWEVAADRVYGFGICAGLWYNRGVLAAFLCLTKAEPVLEPGDPIDIFEVGHLDLKAIGYCGGQIRGNIPFDLGTLHATHRTLRFNEPRSIIRRAVTAGKKNANRRGRPGAI